MTFLHGDSCLPNSLLGAREWDEESVRGRSSGLGVGLGRGAVVLKL